MPAPNKPEDFWKYVNKDTGTDCWDWNGNKDKLGYARFWIKGKRYLIHRYSMMLAGHDIEGLDVCHKCDNPSCCNPEHLFLGSHEDNMKDMVKKGRHVRPASAGKPRKLSNEQALEIRHSTLSSRVLSKMYNINRCTILRIKNGTFYKDIT
jgi:hypothetical protein